jgi:hypothetical protein
MKKNLILNEIIGRKPKYDKNLHKTQKEYVTILKLAKAYS